MTSRGREQVTATSRLVFLPVVHYRWSSIALVLLAVGLLPAWGAGYLVAMFILAGAAGIGLDDGFVPPAVFGQATLLGLLGPVVWCVLFRWYHRRRYSQRTARRRKRLKNVLKRPDARGRLPHRVFELAFYNADRRTLCLWQPIPQAVRECISHIPPGWIVIVCDAGSGHPIAPCGTTASFEPVDAHDLAALTEFSEGEFVAHDAEQKNLHWSEPQPSRTAPQSLGDEPTRERSWPGVVWGYLFKALPLFTLALLIGAAARNGSRFLDLIVAVCVIVIVIKLPRAFSALFYGRRDWLVPGGVVCARHRVWRRRIDIWYAKRSTSPIVCNVESFEDFIGHPAGILKIRAGSLLLKAWRSQAPSPSNEEVQSFVGCDATLV